MILTPFEKAEQNKILHPKRMALCFKVSNLIEKLEEAELFLAVADSKNRNLGPCDYGMYDPDLIATVRAESVRLMCTLAAVSNLWEQTNGVSA
jgi:hypothetical protein